MRILLTGATGQLGSELKELWAKEELLASSSSDLDITDWRKVREAVAGFGPELVLHVGAYTDVEGCEKDPERAYRVNAIGTQNIALAAREVGAAIVYISTNYVFDGTSHRPYLEFDAPNPPNVYGHSKLAGEQYVTQLTHKHYIVRTAWLYGRGPRNFVRTVLRLATGSKELAMVTDEISSPTYAKDLAQAIVGLVQYPLYGIYHFTNSGSCSRYEWAKKILEYTGNTEVTIRPISLKDFQRLAKPPPYSPLRNFCGETQLGITLRPWEEALRDYLWTLRS